VQWVSWFWFNLFLVEEGLKSAHCPYLQTTEVESGLFLANYFQEWSLSNAVDRYPCACWGIFNLSAESFTYEYLGSVESLSAAITSVQDLDFGDSHNLAELGHPPWTSFICFGVHAGELSFAPVRVEVSALDWIPWLVLLVIELGAHGDLVFMVDHHLWDNFNSCRRHIVVHAFWFVLKLFHDIVVCYSPYFQTTEMKGLVWLADNLDECTGHFAIDIHPLAFTGIRDLTAEVFSNEHFGSTKSLSAAITSVQNLNFSDSDGSTELSLPPGTGFICECMHASEFSLSPVGVVVFSLNWIPWLVLFMFPS